MNNELKVGDIYTFRVKRNNKVKIMGELNNCGCKSSYDLRCLCYPQKDYRKTTKYDFRKCPMRFTSATEFILNDYDKYKLIENATTVKDKIKIFKKIIIKDFKLTSEVSSS